VKDAILRKARESADVKEQFFRAEADRIEALARALATAFQRGGRLYVMGNGGGATDFCARFLDANDRPIAGLGVTLAAD